MKISKENNQTIIDGEKQNFIYVQHPDCHDDRIVEVGADNITIKDWGIVCGAKYGFKLEPGVEIEYYNSKFMRRIVVLYRFIKWLFKK